MKKQYIVKSKVRFTIFLTILLLIAAGTITTVFGLNDVNGSSMTQYAQVKVSSGDTLWDIAAAYSDDNDDIRQFVYEISELNDISADQLRAEQTILVPIKG